MRIMLAMRAMESLSSVMINYQCRLKEEEMDEFNACAGEYSAVVGKPASTQDMLRRWIGLGCPMGGAVGSRQDPVGNKKVETFAGVEALAKEIRKSLRVQEDEGTSTLLITPGNKTLNELIKGHPVMTKENTSHGGATDLAYQRADRQPLLRPSEAKKKS